MGCFSWLCTECNKSIWADFVEHKDVRWRSQAVALLPDGRIWEGSYNGYGIVGNVNVGSQEGLELMHGTCWHKAGKPTYRRASEPAEDQGYFLDDEDFKDTLNKNEEEEIAYSPPEFIPADVRIILNLKGTAEELHEFWNMEFARNRENPEKLAQIKPVARAWGRIHEHLRAVMKELEDLTL